MKLTKLMQLMKLFHFTIFMDNKVVPPSTESRYFELDLLRSLAVVSMALYHALVDLKFFYGWDITIFSGVWWLIARSIAITFLLLVGIGFMISHDRARKKGLNGWALYRKYLKRSAVILGAAMLVTGATYLLIPHFYIRFGILHLIGTSTLLLPFFARFGGWNAVIGIFIIGIGNIVFGTRVGTSLLLPLGFVPHEFASLDYFAMLPWMGVILLGMAIGHVVYIRHIGWRSRMGWTEKGARIARPYDRMTRIMTFPGRHALIIYLIHQPLTFAVLIPILGLPTA